MNRKIARKVYENFTEAYERTDYAEATKILNRNMGATEFLSEEELMDIMNKNQNIITRNLQSSLSEILSLQSEEEFLRQIKFSNSWKRID